MKRFLVFAGSFANLEPMGGRFLGETDTPEEAGELAASDRSFDWYTIYDRADRTVSCNRADRVRNTRLRPLGGTRPPR